MSDWTVGRVKSFITTVLRSGARRWPPKYETLREAFVGSIKNKKTNRMAKHYICASCEEWFPQKEVQVDHIEPVVDPLVGFIDWDTFISRLFCPKENLQVLCKSCHLVKSKKERANKNGSNKNNKDS